MEFTEVAAPIPFRPTKMDIETSYCKQKTSLHAGTFIRHLKKKILFNLNSVILIKCVMFSMAGLVLF